MRNGVVHEKRRLEHDADVRRLAALVQQHHVAALGRGHGLAVLEQMLPQGLGVLGRRVLVAGQLDALIPKHVGHEGEAGNRALIDPADVAHTATAFCGLK